MSAATEARPFSRDAEDHEEATVDGVHLRRASQPSRSGPVYFATVLETDRIYTIVKQGSRDINRRWQVRYRGKPLYSTHSLAAAARRVASHDKELGR